MHLQALRSLIGLVDAIRRQGREILYCRTGIVLYQEPEMGAMKDTGIIAVTAAFLIFLSFCVWYSFSSRVIPLEEVLERVSVIVAAVVLIFAVAVIGQHRRLH